MKPQTSPTSARDAVQAVARRLGHVLAAARPDLRTTTRDLAGRRPS